MKPIKRQVTILGEDVNIAYNLATQIIYEKITGHTINLEQLGMTSVNSTLLYASIIANNDDTNINYDRFMDDVDSKELTAGINALSDSIAEWYDLPKIMEKKNERVKTKEEEKASKNL